MMKWLLRPRLPAKITVGLAFAALAYASFRGFSATYAPEGEAGLRPVYGGLFALGAFGAGWIVSRRPPSRLD
jgi:hypothetical protein